MVLGTGVVRDQNIDSADVDWGAGAGGNGNAVATGPANAKPAWARIAAAVTLACASRTPETLPAVTLKASSRCGGADPPCTATDATAPIHRICVSFFIHSLPSGSRQLCKRMEAEMSAKIFGKELEE